MIFKNLDTREPILPENLRIIVLDGYDDDGAEFQTDRQTDRNNSVLLFIFKEHEIA